MKKDFVVGQSNEIIKDGNLYDLHNLYEFLGIYVNTKDSILKIFFHPYNNLQERTRSITFIFQSLDYLELSTGFGTRKIDTLEELGYKEPGDYDINWILNENQSSPDAHLFFRLSKDDYIRVHSKKVYLLEK